VTESVPLDRHTRTAFEKELLALLQDRHVTFDCAARDAIRLNILNSAPRLHGHALGIARKKAGRILPDLELYVQPVILRLGHLRVSGVVGRTLARIAAHEMVHYLDQRHDHDEAGILQPSFTIAQLAGYDSESLMRAQGQKQPVSGPK
jgi:hypothetical protein